MRAVPSAVDTGSTAEVPSPKALTSCVRATTTHAANEGKDNGAAITSSVGTSSYSDTAAQSGSSGHGISAGSAIADDGFR